MTASSRHEGYLPPMPSTPQKGRTASSSSSHSSSSASASTSSAPFPLSPQLASPSSRSPMPYNYHPYQIQTTASSLLTRSNSSPLQPVSEYKHRSSRSMGSMGSMSYLSHSVSDGELAVTAGNHARAVNGGKAGKGLEGDKEARRRSMDGASPVMPKLRRSGTLPVFPRDDQVTPTKDSIPDNPKHWPPAQLARYLTITLRNGDTGHTLPLPLIKDIEAWVLRQQVSGRAFLKGQSESWATSARAPPFLPMLLNISRRLRRSSLQSRLGDTPSSPLPTAPDSPLGSILLEAEENEEVNEEAVSDEDDTGVRRMARLIERPASAASSASSASINGDDNVRPRLNSGNSQAWKEWEARGVAWVGRRRKESGASSCADQAERFGREHQERVVSGGSAGSASSATSATSASSGMSGESEVLETPLDVATIKPARTVPVGLGFEVAIESQASSIPPSSYNPGNINGEKVQMDVADHAGDVVAVSKDQDEMTSPHMAIMLSHQSTGSEPYASIRQAPGSRIPSLRSLRHAQAIRDFATTKSEDGQEADDEMSHLATARRVTLRPTATDIFGAPAAGHNDSEALMRQREREKEMEDQMAVLAARVKQLEEQLQFEREEKDKAVMQHTRWVREREEMEDYFNERQKARSQEEQVKMDDMYRKITRLAEAELLSRPIEGATTTEYDTDSDTTTSNEKEVAGASKAVTKSSRPGTPLDMLPEGVLARLGLIPEQDGLPTRMRELPAYLFFVGVGVGAVMVRLLFSRSR